MIQLNWINWIKVNGWKDHRIRVRPKLSLPPRSDTSRKTPATRRQAAHRGWLRGASAECRRRWISSVTTPSTDIKRPTWLRWPSWFTIGPTRTVPIAVWNDPRRVWRSAEVPRRIWLAVHPVKVSYPSSTDTLWPLENPDFWPKMNFFLLLAWNFDTFWTFFYFKLTFWPLKYQNIDLTLKYWQICPLKTKLLTKNELF